jgi:hypothetical protein
MSAHVECEKCPRLSAFVNSLRSYSQDLSYLRSTQRASMFIQKPSLRLDASYERWRQRLYGAQLIQQFARR